MRIALVTLYNPFEKLRGGIESAVYHQSKSFANISDEVWIVTMGNVKKHTFQEREGIKLWIIPDKKITNIFMRSLLFISQGKTVIEKMDRELKIDLFIGQAGYSGPLVFSKLINGRKILTIHTLDGENIANISDCWRFGHHFQALSEIFKFPALKIWRTFLFSKADCLVFVSNSAFEEFRSFYSFLKKKSCVTIENGSPTEMQNLSNFSSQRDSKFDFVYVGRIDKLKGVDLIIKAASLIRLENSLKIAIIGDGPWRKEIQRLASRLNVSKDISFLGHLDHKTVMNLFTSSRCLILPSFYESDPLVLKEGMSLQLQIICSDIPSLKSKIACYTKGTTFRSGSPEDLSKKMSLLLNQKAESASEQRILLNSNKHEIISWEDNAGRYLKTFKAMFSEMNH
jgi:glycosyltransferase involved in cell wall biosynthesis